MQKIKFKTWSGIWLFVMFELVLVTVTRENSIMDIINLERVEKLLAERRENASLELEQERRLMLQNSVDGDDSFLHNDNEDDEGPSENDPPEVIDTTHNTPKFIGLRKHLNQKAWHRYNERVNSFHSSDSKIHKNRPNFTGIPDVSSLLADFATIRIDKILKSSDRNPQLVTKKEYLKKDWCKTEPILQKIREDGCMTRTILNRFCYGQCNSFYIPKNPPRRRKNRKKQQVQGIEEESEDNSVFKSCGFCKPRRASWIFVTLRCPALMPPFRKKKVQRIKQCKCLSETFN